MLMFIGAGLFPAARAFSPLFARCKPGLSEALQLSLAMTMPKVKYSKSLKPAFSGVVFCDISCRFAIFQD
jgi:hypothetical protein